MLYMNTSFYGVQCATYDVLLHIWYNCGMDKSKIELLSNKETYRTLYQWIEGDKDYFILYEPWCFFWVHYYALKTIAYVEKKIKSRQKIRGYLRSWFLLYLIYRESVENVYRPCGIYETQMAEKWNPILLDF